MMRIMQESLRTAEEDERKRKIEEDGKKGS